MHQGAKQPGRPDRPHIVFLFSDTGGGHRSAANAIIEALELEFPGQTTQELVDIFREYAPPPLEHAPDMYLQLTRVPRVFGAGYHLIDSPRRTRVFYHILWPYIRFGMRRLVREHPADLMVSVHQLINAPMGRMLAATHSNTPFVTVVTDLVSTHAAWYSDRANLVIVPTEIAFQRGKNFGIQPERMRIVGLPVANHFCQPPGDPQEIRARLGWPAHRPVVLLVGGGEGMGPLESMAHAIDAAALPVTLVVIAGRNARLKQKLEKHSWQIPVRIYGFVQDMPAFFQASDILVTKAGPGTISEAFIASLPIVLYSRLDGQEEGNVDYVVDKGAGVWAPRPELVVTALQTWLAAPEKRQAVAATCCSLARPNASRQIASLLMEQIRLKANTS